MVSQELTTDISQRLSDKFGTSVVINKTTPLGGGCIHHATRLETTAGSFFLKWNGSCAADMFIREAEGLREMRKARPDPLVIPEVILFREVSVTPGYLLLEYLEDGMTSGSEEQLGRGLASLHRFGGEKFGFHADNYCGLTRQDNSWSDDWPAFFGEKRIWALVEKCRKSRGFSSGEIKLFERLVAGIPGLIAPVSIPSLIHGDLWSGNYLFSRKGPSLIDPASCYADREMEMGIMTLFGGFSRTFWAAYHEAYPLPHDWKDRNRLYQLYHVLNHYLLFGGHYGSSAVEIARHYV